jgi:hypothetical protein
LRDWEEPARTREGALAALRLAIEEDATFQGAALLPAMLAAALAYFEAQS